MTGEDFQLWQLAEEQGVTPFQYYLYGFGFGDGTRGRGFWNIVSGDGGMDSWSDYNGFAEYRNTHVDTTVYQKRFQNVVKRSLTSSTGFTLPWWNIGVKGDLGWSQEFTQNREDPMEIDTTGIWPKVGVGIDIPNFANRIEALKGKLRSLSTSHRLDYTEGYQHHAYQATEDVTSTSWDFNPLIRISALTANNIRIDNSVRLKIEEGIRRPKEALDSTQGWADSLSTQIYLLRAPYIYTWLYKERGYAVGDEFSLSYPLKAKRGFQLWRWYIKLENDIDLRLTAGYNYKKVIQESYSPVAGYNMLVNDSTTSGKHATYTTPGGTVLTAYNAKLERVDRQIPTRAHEWYVRPSAAYTFSKMVSASAYIEYRHLTELLSSGTKHTLQSLSFEIALMLRFN
jgi:cell surface protein SprA